ncbi:MAG: hypothetical protein ACRYFS_01585 [Janthinobacterium lividum]
MISRSTKYFAAAICLLLSVGAQAAPEQARSADSFVDSIGVNTHWNYPDTPYGSEYARVKQLIVASGIRHVRGEFSRARDLAASGITTMVCLGPGHNEDGSLDTVRKFQTQVKAANAGGINAVDWVEGPNEPDLFWQKSENGDAHGYGAITYQGQGYAQGDQGIIQGVMAFQKDLYTVFKADPATASLKIIGPALGKTYGYDVKSPYGVGTLSHYVDYGNFHPYPGGNPFSDRAGYDTLSWYIGHGTQPSANMDEFPYAFDVYAPPFAPQPMACSESGYSTFTNGQTEAVQAKYIPRLFCEYFLHQIKRTYLYEFLDAFDNKSDRDSNFGLVRHDLSPKPSYSAVKNLLSLLSDKGAAAFQPKKLDYTLAVSPVLGYKEPGSGQAVNYDRTQYVHHLLLQKRSGDFFLVLWHEISDEDGGVDPHRVVTPPAMPTILTLPTSIKSATVFVPNNSMTGSPMPIRNNHIQLSVPDELMIVRLSNH